MQPAHTPTPLQASRGPWGVHEASEASPADHADRGS